MWELQTHSPPRGHAWKHITVGKPFPTTMSPIAPMRSSSAKVSLNLPHAPGTLLVLLHLLDIARPRKATWDKQALKGTGGVKHTPHVVREQRDGRQRGRSGSRVANSLSMCYRLAAAGCAGCGGLRSGLRCPCCALSMQLCQQAVVAAAVDLHGAAAHIIEASYLCPTATYTKLIWVIWRP